MKELLNQWYAQSQQVSPVRIAGLNRRRFVQLLGEHGLVHGAEIGVERGRFSEYIFKNTKVESLVCVDPWKWKRSRGQHEDAVRRLSPYNARIIWKPSLEALAEVEDESLDFVYIDGDHTFDYVMTDIIWWSKKVRIGGVVSGHDYYRFRRAGVVPAVDVYTREHGITRWFVTDEKLPTWFWIRERSVVDEIEQ